MEYRRSGEKRWVNMLRTAFYIVERAQPNGGEVKEMEPDPTEGLAPIEVGLADFLTLEGRGEFCWPSHNDSGS